MSYETILVNKKDKVGIITLNRPEAKNTFTVKFAKEINESLEFMDNDSDIRVVVIDAKGKHFSTGIDLNEFKNKSHAENRKLIKAMDKHNHTLARMKKPVIASVKGYTIANGAGLCFACDLVIAADNTRFGTTAINVGLICLGPAVPLIRSVGRRKTMEMILTGDLFSAQEAQKLGLVNKIVPEEELEESTLEVASKLAEKSPLALQIGKVGVYGMSDLPYHQALDYMSELFASLCSTEDAHEGLKAFVEHRSPVWKGK